MGTSHRTIETPVFYFDQLSDEAKEKAREWWRELEAADPAWSQERRQSLEDFCKVFPVQAREWSYDQWSYSMTSRLTGDDTPGDMSGPRLVAYLWNNYKDILTRPKVYGKDPKTRRSRVIREENDCPFTGYCADEALLGPIRTFLKKPTDKDFVTLLDDCLQAWAKDCQEDCAWILEDEQVDETILANEYEFDATGKRV